MNNSNNLPIAYIAIAVLVLISAALLFMFQDSQSKLKATQDQLAAKSTECSNLKSQRDAATASNIILQSDYETLQANCGNKTA